MRIEVAYALPQRQSIIELEVEPGCNALSAAQRSGIDREFPEIDWQTVQLGVFGKLLDSPTEYVLNEGDRIEIYRPLLIDPKAVRRARAAQKQRKTKT